MAAGTKHFLFNRPEDWLELGVMDALTAQGDGLILRGAGKGLYVSMALDTLETGTVWHRLRMVFQNPGNGLLRLYIYCSDHTQTPPPFAPEWPESLELDDYLRSASPNGRETFFTTCAQHCFDNPEDLPLYGFSGRYLWFCLVLLSYGEQEISVESLKLEFPRTAFIDYLPQVYRDSESTNSFLARFISVFQSVYVDLEDDMDLAPVRCDPAVAPPDFLRWLAECLALSERFLWDEEKMRTLVKNAVHLYRIKGTKRALCEVLDLYTGQLPLIIEQFEPASADVWRQDTAALRKLYGGSKYTFTVIMPRMRPDPDSYAKIWKVIEAFKPVDAVCNLVFLEDAIVLGRHCYLGMNTRITSSKELVLDGTVHANAPYLAEFETGGMIDGQPAIQRR